jgi:hypothetical protein
MDIAAVPLQAARGLLGWARARLSNARKRLKPKHPAGPPMTLGNMRALGVQGRVAS